MELRRVTYFQHIGLAVRSLWQGLALTFRHLRQSTHSQRPVSIADPTYFDNRHGIATIQYPHQNLPVPDNGRYRLHNEIDDCIVCDKCAKICPVNCITIEPIRAAEEIGKTSDGTSKRIYAATFDIDMGKCCFCGLCTTVCPTECLTMTRVYDFSTFDIRDHNYAFSEMTEQDVVEKKNQFELFQQRKKASAAEEPQTPASDSAPAPAKTGRPVFKPRIKPPGENS